MGDDFAVMDGRAFTNVDNAEILVIDTLKECCEAANEGTYGDGCAVVQISTMEIVWQCFSTGTWKCENI